MQGQKSENAPTAAPILVTGGTGTLGKLVVPRLLAAGHRVRVLSRHGHETTEGVEYVVGDLLKSEGIKAAVAGVEIVVHLAGGPRGDDVAARNLVGAASRADLRQLVHISVTGADRIPIGYFTAKLGAERAIAESGLPWTTLRPAQFHELILTVMHKIVKLPARLGNLFQGVERRHGVRLSVEPPAYALHR